MFLSRILPDRTVNILSPAGSIADSQTYLNTFAGSLRNPRSVGWNLELDRQVTSSFAVRAGFQERNTSRDFVLDPDASRGLLALSNTGHSFYREFEVTGRYKVRRGMLNASYVRSKAVGNLNDFNQFFGNNGSAVIEPDQQGSLPFDAPNRVLAWGEWDAPFQIDGSSASRCSHRVSLFADRPGARIYRAAGLPAVSAIRVVRSSGHEARCDCLSGTSISRRGSGSRYSIYSTASIPRDVQNDVDSARFGAMFNGVGRIFRGKFTLEF